MAEKATIITTSLHVPSLPLPQDAHLLQPNNADSTDQQLRESVQAALVAAAKVDAINENLHGQSTSLQALLDEKTPLNTDEKHEPELEERKSDDNPSSLAVITEQAEQSEVKVLIWQKVSKQSSFSYQTEENEPVKPSKGAMCSVSST